MTFGQRLKQVRKQAGLTQRQVAESIDAKHNSVSNWENNLNTPDPTIIEQLCRLLKTSPNFLLMGRETTLEASPGLTSGEQEFIEDYRLLDDNAKGAINALLNYYKNKEDKLTASPIIDHLIEDIPELTLIRSRISIQPVAAGTGTYLDEDMFEEFTVIDNPVTRNASFFVPVEGDSMEPRFHDGDILVVRDTPVQLGEIGIFTLDGYGYVKIHGTRELVSINKQYAPILMNDDIICNGKVIGVLDPDWIVTK